MNYRASIIKLPSGHYGFVGSLPSCLAIRNADGSELSQDEFENYRRCQSPALLKRRCGYVEPTFKTEQEAYEFAAENGVVINYRGES